MSLNQSIEEHRTQGDNPDGTYTVTRTPERAYDAKGRLQPAAAPVTFPIVASVQTQSPEDISDVPEGQSSSDAKLILTATELRTRRDGNEPDTIVIKGLTYVIHSVDEVEHWGEIHYECVALRVPSA